MAQTIVRGNERGLFEWFAEKAAQRRESRIYELKGNLVRDRSSMRLQIRSAPNWEDVRATQKALAGAAELLIRRMHSNTWEILSS